MLNGRKNAVIGISALLAFVLAELAMIFCAIGLFLEVVLDVDVPLL